EAAHIPGGVLGATLPGNGGETHKHRRLLALLGKGRRAGEMVETVEAFEETMGSRAAGMHDTFGDPFMVKVGDLLAEDEVLEQRRPANSRLERGLVVSN